jgi:serine/threonine protein kinase
LADIGLVAQQSDASTCVGSLGYNAPEGSGRPAADVYSVGRMLFEMYSGIAVQSLTGPLPDLRPRLSQPRQVAFDEVILRACAPAVAARLPGAGALLEALVPFVPQRAEFPVPGAG